MNIADTPTPPIAARKDSGTDDPYAWLRADNWQDVIRDPAVLDPEIRAYLVAENAYTERALAPVRDLASALVGEMRARIKEDDASVPVPVDDFRYFVRYEQGGQHPLYCRTKGDDGPEEILLDADDESAGEAFYRVATWVISADHKRYAYTVDLAGGEDYRLRVRSSATGALIEDTLNGLSGDLMIANDSETIFYVRRDDNHRPRWVYRHRIGDDGQNDVMVYEEPDKGFYVSLGRTESRKYITIDCAAHDDTAEVRLIDADAPHQPPVLVAPRDTGVSYSVYHRVDELVIVTNADGAEDFKIVTCPVATPTRAHWRDLVPHKPGRLILGLNVFADYIVRLERVDALPRLVVRTVADGAESAIAFDEPAYDLSQSHEMPHGGSVLRFSYSSMTTPQTVYDYDLATGARTLRKRQEVPSGHDAADYVTERLMAQTEDGEQVPISLLYKKGTPRDGSAPLLLYGYGSYGISMPASFQSNRLSLMDRGFVYAIAHIRGGMEKGYGWYRSGKLHNKKNTFADFIASAEHLIAQGYTSKGKIAAHGGSAGGLLMGAVVNMRPDLFGAVVADVPFVDVLATILDDSLPLTPPEWVEWGNPIEDAEARAYIASYSPYDNVTAQAYPAMLVTGGVSDPRVTYWEPAKWVAKLRATKTDTNALLLNINMDTGHGGKAGRFARLDEIGRMYAFILWALGRA
ncbi:MAG: S9 family peptidase [Proteobacteria bacterium]|nr:S9 family peptidase [Pseudomonadota bacterium]MDA1058410.1 S9 family peptidase [Pseudomonadota bacterium]